MSVSSPAWLALNAKYIDGERLCGYGCGRVAVEGDHIVARARGGTDEESNYCPSCRKCNAKKQAGPPPRAAYVSPLAQRIHGDRS